MKTLCVIMSELCNLNCSYCHVDKKATAKVDLDLVMSQYNALRQQDKDEIILIDFFGGEPLLQFDTIQQIVEMTEHDPNVQYGMPTNALLLDEKKLNFIIEKKIKLSISFDGIWQDENRKQFTGNGTLINFLHKKDLIKQIPNLKIHAMINPGNDNLLENEFFVRDMFGVSPQLTLVRDNVWNKETVENLKDGIKQLFDWYIDHPETQMPEYIKFYLQHILLYNTKKIELDNCGAGSDLIAVNPTDGVLPCYRFKGRPDISEKIPQFKVMSECQTCEVKNYCKKGCLFEQIKNDGPIQELCDLYKFTYKEVFRMIKDLHQNVHFKHAIQRELHNV